MTTSNKRVALLLGVSIVLAPVCVSAQVRDTGAIRQKVRAEKPKLEKFQGEVLQMTRLAITVRQRGQPAVVRTFTFDEKLAGEMATLVDRNHAFQHGDRVEIHFRAGSDTAVRIKGKPSPPRGGIR